MHLLNRFVRSLRYKSKLLSAVPQTVFSGSRTSMEKMLFVLPSSCKNFALFLAKKAQTNPAPVIMLVQKLCQLQVFSAAQISMPKIITAFSYLTLFSVSPFFTNCYDCFHETECWFASNYISADHDHVSPFGTEIDSRASKKVDRNLHYLLSYFCTCCSFLEAVMLFLMN